MIRDFLTSKMSKMGYESVCKKMKDINTDIIEKNNDFILKSKIGELELYFDSQNQETKLTFNNEIVFHKEDIYADTEVHINDSKRIKFIQTYLKEQLDNKNQLTRKEAIDSFNRIENKMRMVDLGNWSENSKNGVFNIENNINNLYFKHSHSFIGNERDDLTTIHLGNELIYKKHTNNSGDKILTLKSSLLEQAHEMSLVFSNDNEDVKEKKKSKLKL